MSTSPDGHAVLITLEDIYRQLVALNTRVDTALTKLDRTEQLVAEHDAELRPLAGAAERINDHEIRIRQLERSRWPVTSLTVLTALGSLAVAILVAVYRK